MELELACTVCGMEQQRWGSFNTTDAVLNAAKYNLTKLTGTYQAVIGFWM